MPVADLIPIIALAAGFGTAMLVLLFRRFGRGSWLLALFLLPASAACAALAFDPLSKIWSLESLVRLSYSLLVLAAPLGVMASYTLVRDDYAGSLRANRVSMTLNCAAAAATFMALHLLPLPEPEIFQPGEVQLGPVAYVAALYLVVASVIVLANMEQTLRSAPEHLRWQIKFMLLGTAASFGALIYIASKVLLYPLHLGLVAVESMRLFPAVFLVSCLLTLLSWKRSSGRGGMLVSQRAFNSTITLIAVGAYLIISSVVAKWLSRTGELGIPVEAFIFLIALLGLSVILLWTDLRHRIKWWIRRSVFAGTFDYRRFWLEASERVRSVDEPEVAASALLAIVQKALGSIELSVWLRLWNPNRLKLLSAFGQSATLKPEYDGIVERFIHVMEPVPTSAIELSDTGKTVAEFIAETRASVLVPLQSSDRLVGILMVGPDRSGRPYNWEALQFLGVLASHAAGEFHKSELLSALVQSKETEAFRTFSTFLLHDLKNFASTLSLIARNAGRHQDNPQFQADAFKAVYETAEKMKKLCTNLRTFSGTLAADRRPHDLNKLAVAAAEQTGAEIRGKVRLELGELPQLQLDGEEIASVVKNLLLNSYEALGEGGFIRLTTRRDGDWIELAVQDNGCGIKSGYLKNEIFLPFHTTKSDGLGIGLFHCRKIVEAHQGSIRVESEEGKGTTVRLRFPAAPAAARANVS